MSLDPPPWSSLLWRFESGLFRSTYVIASLVFSAAAIVNSLRPSVALGSFDFSVEVSFDIPWALSLGVVCIVLRQTAHIILKLFFCPEVIKAYKRKTKYVAEQTAILMQPSVMDELKKEFTAKRISEIMEIEEEATSQILEEIIRSALSRLPNSKKKSPLVDPLVEWDKLDCSKESSPSRLFFSIAFYFSAIGIVAVFFLYFPIRSLFILGFF